MKCHWTTYKGQPLFLPGCEPGWYDEKNCICRRPMPKEPTAEQKLIKELEKENARLNRLLRNLLTRRT